MHSGGLYLYSQTQHEFVSRLQDLSRIQESVLFLDLTTLQGSELYLDVFGVYVGLDMSSP
jgi:hypothetical protein